MLRKIVVIVGLITLLIVVSGMLGFRTLSDADRVDQAQVRALGVLHNVEHLQVQSTQLDHLAYDLDTSKNPRLRGDFWKQYNRIYKKVETQVMPLHGGDCKPCHTEMLRLAPELAAIQKNLAVLDRNRRSPGSVDTADGRALIASINALRRSARKIDGLSTKELRHAMAQVKALTVTPGAKLQKKIGRRFARASTMSKNAKAINYYGWLLTQGIAGQDPQRVQTALRHLSDLTVATPIKPPLNGVCFSCHQALNDLLGQTKAIARAANGLAPAHVAGVVTPEKKVLALKPALARFEGTTAKILDLARSDFAHSMKEAKRVRNQLRTFMVALDLTVILATLLSAAFVLHWLRKRLSSLLKAIEAISEGDYAYYIDAGGRDEVAALAHAFNLMMGRVRSSQERLTLLNKELRELHVNTVRAFIEAIEAKDPYTRGHSENVAKYALLIGQSIGMPDEQLEKLHVAALLHDIGKIGIREDILNKEESLTDQEYQHIKTHPMISAQIIGRIPNLVHIATAIQHHHECFNGNGYPAGLAGDSIPLEARILSIADAFDAMTSDRPYRDGCSKQEALDELKRYAGTQFDPKLVEAFIAGVTSLEAPSGGDVVSAA